MICSQCKQHKDKFYRRSGGGFYKVCADCTKLNAKDKYKQSKRYLKPITETINPIDRDNLRAGLIAGFLNIRSC